MTLTPVSGQFADLLFHFDLLKHLVGLLVQFLHILFNIVGIFAQGSENSSHLMNIYAVQVNSAGKDKKEKEGGPGSMKADDVRNSPKNKIYSDKTSNNN